MERLNSVKIVEEFWSAVWKARNPDAIDRIRMFLLLDVLNYYWRPS
jgi:hypothetical protein